MSAAINALIAQGGPTLGSGLPEVANMLNQRAQQTLQNNRLATQDQYAAEEHAQRADQYNKQKTDEDAKRAFTATEYLKRVGDADLPSAVQQFPPLIAALQKAGVDPAHPDSLDHMKAIIDQVHQVTGAHLGIAPPKQFKVVGDINDPNQGVYKTDPDSGDISQVRAPRDPLEGLKFGETVKHDRATENQAAAALRASEAARANGGAPPSGYRLAKDGTGNLEVIPGGPADKTAGLGGRESVMFQRVASSAKAGLQDLKNISELPVGASTGFLGVGSSPGHSIMASARDALRNKLSSQDVQDYNTMIAGLSRNLSTIETAGLAPNGSITASMDSIMLREGDSGVTKLRKLAQARQIIIRGIETNLANPKLPKEQKELVQQIMDDTAAAVPFTQHDITEMQSRQTKNANVTLMDVAGQKGLGKSGSHPSDIQSILDKYPSHDYAGPG